MEITKEKVREISSRIGKAYRVLKGEESIKDE